MRSRRQLADSQVALEDGQHTAWTRHSDDRSHIVNGVNGFLPPRLAQYTTSNYQLSGSSYANSEHSILWGFPYSRGWWGVEDHSEDTQQALWPWPNLCMSGQRAVWRISDNCNQAQGEHVLRTRSLSQACNGQSTNQKVIASSSPFNRFWIWTLCPNSLAFNRVNERATIKPSASSSSVCLPTVPLDRDYNIDCEFTTLLHINNISLICFFRLHRLRKLRQLLDTAKPQRKVATITISRVDYCNAVLAGQPAATSLRRDLSAAARLVIGLDVHDIVSARRWSCNTGYRSCSATLATILQHVTNCSNANLP